MAAAAVVTVVFTYVCISITTITFATGLEALVVVVCTSVSLCINTATTTSAT